jgi:short-subunit dehydrogenase
MNTTRPLAAITGASSGIGAEFARQLALRGYDLLLIARREDRLRELADSLPTTAEILVADLTDPTDRTEAASRLATDPRLHLLVNNAGFGTRRRFWEADLDGQLAMHELHVMATVALTHPALGNMQQRNAAGAVINVASVAAFARSPSNTSYCATKAWTLAFSEGLALDLRSAGSAIRVQALCPGFTYSEFHDALGVDRERMAPRSLWMSAAQVVRASLEGMDQGKLVVVPGWRYRLFSMIFPRLPSALRLAAQQRSPHTRGRM